MNYAEIKRWLAKNRDKMPVTMDCGYCYFENVPEVIRTYIGVIEATVKRLEGSGVKMEENALIRASMGNLNKMVNWIEGDAKKDVGRPDKFKAGKLVLKSGEVKEVKRKISKKEQEHIDNLSRNDIFVDLTNRNLAFPTGVIVTKETEKSVGYFKKKGFLSTRATF